MLSKAERAETALARYKSTAMSKIQEQRGTVRTVVTSVEIVGGAAAAGYLDAKFGSSTAGMGISPSLGGGLLLLGLGVGMRQKDVSGIALGMLAGAAYKKGAESAV